MLAVLTTTKKRAAWHTWLRRWGHISTVSVNISIVILALMLLLVLFADVFATHEINAMDLRNRSAPPAIFVEAGTSDHILGTDSRGRDMFTRLLYGGRVSLLVGAVATVLGLALGTILGLVSGYLRGWADHIVMYLVDFQLSLPFLLLAVAVALILGTSLPVLIGLAALATWPIYARLVRGIVFSLRSRDYVVAARAAGASTTHIFATHLLPNLVGPLLVIATLTVGRIILLESGLSFLGIGIQPPTPSWGNMINEGREYLTAEWWLAAIPGMALVLLVLSVGTIGDWLRDLSDVKIN